MSSEMPILLILRNYHKRTGVQKHEEDFESTVARFDSVHNSRARKILSRPSLQFNRYNIYERKYLR